MAPTSERGERSCGKRVREKAAMASHRIAKDRGLPGLWLASPGGGSPIWGWSGDEETLLLLEFETEEGGDPEPEKVLSGPWTFEGTNPFVGNVWTPLKL